MCFILSHAVQATVRSAQTVQNEAPYTHHINHKNKHLYNEGVRLDWLQRWLISHAWFSNDVPVSSVLDSTASNSPRTTPTGSPAVRKRLLASGPSSRSCEGDAMVEKGSDSSSEKGPAQSPNYPPAARNFTRNAKVRFETVATPPPGRAV